MKFNASKYNTHWQDKELSELGSFQRGKSKHRPRNDQALFNDGKYPLVQTGEVKGANLFINKHSSAYNDFGLSQSKIWPENTLCITIAANIAETALLKYPMCFPDSIVGFVADKDESSELFMHYVFTYIRRAIQNSANGSIQDNINIEYLTSLKFKIPNKGYQDRIVHLLACLDNKIELNNRINIELEGKAKLIYDFWFVQFDFPDANGEPYKSSGEIMVYNEELKREVPVGWTIDIINNVIDVKDGTHDSPKAKETGYPLITSKHLKPEGLDFERANLISEEDYNSVNKRSQVATGDILFSMIGSIGEIYKVDEKTINFAIKNVALYKSSKKPEYTNFIYTFLKSYDMKRYMGNVTSGSIQKFIGLGALRDMPIFTNDDMIMKFVQNTEHLFQKKTLIKLENQELTKLRDWLLPMFMNGQVTVK
jgi:type I restriction enzyme S subunit